MKSKLIILVISIIYIIYLLVIFTANIYYNQSTVTKDAERSLRYIKSALFFNPFNSEYHYQKYYLLKSRAAGYRLEVDSRKLIADSVNSIQRAIELQPSNASYHMFYALALIKRYPHNREPKISQLINGELRKACELKPSSKLYQDIYRDYGKQ